MLVIGCNRRHEEGEEVEEEVRMSEGRERKVDEWSQIG